MHPARDDRMEQWVEDLQAGASCRLVVPGFAAASLTVTVLVGLCYTLPITG
jgi:hypothetical protein